MFGAISSSGPALANRGMSDIGRGRTDPHVGRASEPFVGGMANVPIETATAFAEHAGVKLLRLGVVPLRGPLQPIRMRQHSSDRHCEPFFVAGRDEALDIEQL